jgi:hypothetical protein
VDVVLERVSIEQMSCVHAAALSKTVNASDALLEPRRAPGQLEIDYQPAAFLQIQPFASGVGR